MPIAINQERNLLIVEFGQGDIIVSTVRKEGEQLPVMLFGVTNADYKVGDMVETQPDEFLQFQFINLESVQVVQNAMQRLADAMDPEAKEGRSPEETRLQERIVLLEADLAQEKERNEKAQAAIERVLESKDAVEEEREKHRREGQRWFDEAFDHLRAIVEIENVIGRAQAKGGDIQKAFRLCLDVAGKRKASPEFRTFIEEAIAVARLNIDQEDSIRPMTNGAVESFERLETALLVGDLAEVAETEYTQRVRATVWRKRGNR